MQWLEQDNIWDLCSLQWSTVQHRDPWAAGDRLSPRVEAAQARESVPAWHLTSTAVLLWSEKLVAPQGALVIYQLDCC